MVKCPVCGTDNPDNAIFCFKCGYRFSENSEIESNKNELKENKIEKSKNLNLSDELYKKIYINASIAFSFSLISLLIFLILTTLKIASLIYLISNLSYYEYMGNFKNIYFSIILMDIILIMVFLVFLIGSIIMFLRNYVIYEKFISKNFKECYNNITESTIILSLIFGLIVTGLFLIFQKFDLEKYIKLLNL